MQRNLIISVILFTLLNGCVTQPPENLLRMDANVLGVRQIQSRRYETQEEQKMLSAASSVLQDLGFTLDNSEPALGFLLGSKNRSAVNKTQVTAAIFADALSAATGSYSGGYGASNSYMQTDKEQKIQAAVVVNRSLNHDGMIVRVAFQRMVWNRMGQLSKFETLKEGEMYTGFFDKLSKAVFLEEHQI
jgi:hypothetical protein